MWPQGLGRNVHVGFWKCSAGLDSRIRDLTTFFVNSAHLHRIQPVDAVTWGRSPLLMWTWKSFVVLSFSGVFTSSLRALLFGVAIAENTIMDASYDLETLAKCDLLHKVCDLAKAVEWPKFFHRSSSAVGLSFLRTWMWTALNPKSRHSRIHEPSPTDLVNDQAPLDPIIMEKIILIYKWTSSSRDSFPLPW